MWKGSLSGSGYGIISMPRTGGGWGNRSAHRVAWELYRGAIPPGTFVLHRCDVKRCVKPSHLFLGTAADNLADMAQKGRATGKLAIVQVAEIKARLASGEGSTSLAREFAVYPNAIDAIRAGASYRWVAAPPVEDCREGVLTAR